MPATINSIEKHYEVIIVGAGIQGLCAAHTFLSINPSLSLLVVDNESSVGGTWSKRRIFPGLYANNLQGFFEYSDYPMLDANVGVTPRGTISGEAACTYLEKYADTFELKHLILFNTKVVRATNIDDDESKAWNLDLVDVDSKDKQGAVTCSKLLVATGQTSTPWYPEFVGSFKKPSIHTANFGSDSPAILEDKSINRVSVIGGGKSAHDAVFALVNAGKQVNWILRKTGRGGTWMAKSFPQLGPFSVWLEGLLMTRILSWFGACPWSEGDGFGWARHFLHRTSAGRFITRNYFANMSKSTIEQSGVNKQENTKQLIPKETLQWYGGQAAILHYTQDFYDLTEKAGVTIITANITRAEADALILDDGQRIEADAVIYATGYKFGPSFPLEPEARRARWGVPLASSSLDEKQFQSLEERADAELFASFPELELSPKYPEREPELGPWRLWRFIAPPSQVPTTHRNLAFLTNVETYQNVLKGELVSLWSYAYLYDQLSVQPGSVDEVTYEATLWSRFGKWRCPMGSQGKTGDTFHDNLPYYDLLLRDLGLKTWRKGWGIFGEVFGGWYELKDYKGIVQEWMATRESDDVPARGQISL